MSSNYYLPPSPVIPMSLEITNISNSYPMVITVALPNTYIPRMLVKLTVPPDYGMTQADELTAEIVSINGLNLSVAIDSTKFDVFVTPTVNQEKPASLAPAGSRNLQYSNSTNLVPFQSLGNIGN